MLKTIPKLCPCGKEHIFSSRVIIEDGAIYKLPAILQDMGQQNAFLFADQNTYAAAGQAVADILSLVLAIPIMVAMHKKINCAQQLYMEK